MSTKITLKAARVNAGYRLIDAAKEIGINKDTLTKLERDSSDIPRSTMHTMAKLYNHPLDNIFFGVESDFIRNIRIEKLEEAN